MRSVPSAPPLLERRDLKTNTVTGTVALQSVAAGVVATPAGVWVVETNGQLLRLDPFQPTLEGSTNVGGRPASVVIIGNSLWIDDSAGDRLLRVDSNTGRITDRIQLTSQPSGLATDGHTLWVALPYPAAPATAS